MGNLLERMADFFKELVALIGEGILAGVVSAFSLFHLIVYKILVLFLSFATIGFAVGIIFLALNVMEAFDGTWITNTQYFNPMLWLFAIYIVLFTLCRIIRPKYL